MGKDDLGPGWVDRLPPPPPDESKPKKKRVVIKQTRRADLKKMASRGGRRTHEAFEHDRALEVLDDEGEP
jgi:hypothetical protein